jgi:hypothetical protein
MFTAAVLMICVLLNRTDTDYDDALIAKLYIFMFVNSYAALFFVAFIKVGLLGAVRATCCVRCSKLAVTSLWGGAVSIWAVLIARTRILRACFCCCVLDINTRWLLVVHR